MMNKWMNESQRTSPGWKKLCLVSLCFAWGGFWPLLDLCLEDLRFNLHQWYQQIRARIANSELESLRPCGTSSEPKLMGELEAAELRRSVGGSAEGACFLISFFTICLISSKANVPITFTSPESFWSLIIRFRNTEKVKNVHGDNP